MYGKKSYGGKSKGSSLTKKQKTLPTALKKKIMAAKKRRSNGNQSRKNAYG